MHSPLRAACILGNHDAYIRVVANISLLIILEMSAFREYLTL